MCFFKDTNRRDVVKMRDDVVPRNNPIWEKTIDVSVCFTSYSMKCIYIVCHMADRKVSSPK